MNPFKTLYASVQAMAGNYLYVSGKTETAAAILQKAIDNETHSPAAHLHYAIYLVRKGEGERALVYLEKAAALKPKPLMEKNIKLTSASCFWIMGQVGKAREILEAMQAEYEYVNAHVLTTLGYMYFLEGNYEKAEEASMLAVEDMPASGAAWDNLGQIYYRRGLREKAADAFHKALENKADLPDSLFYMGRIASEEGNKEKARAYFVKAAACDISALNTVSREQIEAALNSL